MASSYINTFNDREPDSSLTHGLSTEEREVFAKAMSGKIALMSFSDTTVYYSRVSDSEGVFQLRPLYAIMMGLAIVALASLAAETPIRGAIEVDVGCEPFLSEVYGPCLMKAHYLESRQAQFPRIVVGPSAIDMIGQIAKNRGESGIERLNARMAKNMLEHIIVASDGQSMLDFASPFIQRMLTRHSGDLDWLRGAIDFAEQQYAVYKKSGNHKISERYRALINYLQSRTIVSF
jgi:hypothetical protein